ncbi:MAG: UDP-N-acetylglucosamine 2-epimerase (non-hydrolyzing), partial [Gammaproteobacteria bacterium]|nr:UDP-N-acetylglucosamine 2-epimerase (non-hydrolyzing) [Gammaproteobacteria bacterium]
MGTRNLLKEGIPQEVIHFVGNVMIDNLLYQLEKLSDHQTELSTYPLKERLPEQYLCMTLHRPSNVD